MSKKPHKISLIGSRATSVLSVALVLIVAGLCATLGIAVHRATRAISNETTIIVTITPGEDPLNVSEMKRAFNTAEWVDHYDFTDAKTVLRREAHRMSDDALQALELLSDNPFGDEFVLYIAPDWRSSDSISVLVDHLARIESVDIVSGDTSALGEANDGLNRVLLYLGILAAILLIISIALINNTISLSIYSRRFNIHTMKLVGATNAFIRRPFVRAGMYTGLIAGLIAAVVVCGIQIYLMFNDSLVGAWITSAGVVLTAAAIIVTGAVIARAAAWRAATVYLNKSFNHLYKK